MTNTIKILLADDHRLFLEGIRSIIDNEPGMEVVSVANNGEEVLLQLDDQPVDVIMLDVEMPVKNGIATAQALAAHYPRVKVIALSMHTEHIFINKMYSAGVAGYVLKNTSKEELITAIKTVYDGGRYYSREIIPVMLDNSPANVAPPHHSHAGLTKRETEVLILIAREYSNPEIAEALFLSILTVNTHRKNLLKKLDVKNTAGLVKYALMHNLV